MLQKIKPIMKKGIKNMYASLPQRRKVQLRSLTDFVFLSEWQNRINRVTQLCTPTSDKELQKKILKENLKHIEIEISSFCNRTCWFCPNSIIDRKSKNIEFPENEFLKIVQSLKEIDYSGSLGFIRYNEPLANKELVLKRIRQAKDALPNAQLSIYSNGDYITRELLDELRDAGVTEIIMSYYFGKDKPWDVERTIKPAIEKMSKKLNLKYKLAMNTQDQYGVLFDYPGVYFYYRSWNPYSWGVSRGNSVDEMKGVSTDTKDKLSDILGDVTGCYHLANQMAVDYNGNVMACCNTRSDNEAHKHFIVGNVFEKSIFDIFCGEKACELRRELFLSTLDNPVCTNCWDRRMTQFLNEFERKPTT